jgi:hypothetical protein
MRALGISFGAPTNRPLTPRDKLGHPVQVEPLGNGNTFISVPERAGPDVTPDVDSTSGPRTGDSGGSTRGGGGGGIVDPPNPNP